MRPRRFANRTEAGRALAERLATHAGTATTVLALPRGGVPVAAEVARALSLPLDLLLVRKLGVPSQPELAAGAVAGSDGQCLVVNDEIAAAAGLDRTAIERLATAERQELRARAARYLEGRVPGPVAGRTAILVDDGIATGATMEAAIAAARAMGARQVVVAVPVAPPRAANRLEALADELVCLETPGGFRAVGDLYADFRQVPDVEVRRLLAEAAQRDARD